MARGHQQKAKACLRSRTASATEAAASPLMTTIAAASRRSRHADRFARALSSSRARMLASRNCCSRRVNLAHPANVIASSSWLPTKCSDGHRVYGPLAGPGNWLWGGDCYNHGNIVEFGW
ncbi:hypothetical protein [Amycolatopsis alba]|uniref:Uncharacterized protein n=1 Tax=Amycolatopsis alba DSM 44262 TaxID=1125972 RepID=A0A229RSP2_AMYAL|nr:hypothetical protein [Amycolatopsis alba]OXM49693.1 hypothetical protein CFP75_18150 [Amycolatopsis alba DSM 44262]